MKITRRNFVKSASILGLGIASKKSLGKDIIRPAPQTDIPIIISTWSGGLRANEQTMKVLGRNGNVLDAIEEGIHVIENDPNDMSVGYGGLPDADGNVTLDASIMNWRGDAGAVSYLQNIKNPISVARLVMEKTPHVMLSGQGAKKFALQNGFKEENLLTEKSKEAWEKWKAKQTDPGNHDTIGLLAIDSEGKISGGVSTSGWGFKIPGRVGDSPIIGAGLYVNGKVGAACSTGLGEWAIKSVGSFLIVEKMREGLSPQEACEFAIRRVDSLRGENDIFQLAFIAVNKYGEFGGYSLRDGFSYSVTKDKVNEVVDTGSLIKRKNE